MPAAAREIRELNVLPVCGRHGIREIRPKLKKMLVWIVLLLLAAGFEKGWVAEDGP